MELVGNGVAYFHFLVMSNELNTPKILLCPNDTNRLAATNWDSLRDHSLSYFVGLDASELNPQMFISGNDNFTINGAKPRRGLVSLSTNDTATWLPTRHVNQGNICFADGSVQSFSSSKLREALRNTGVSTNRLVLP